MAAPSGTKWGSKVNDRGRIGIAVSRSYSNSTVKVTLSVWFWSKYGVSDSGNTLYLNNKSTSATFSKGSKNIYTSHNSGSGWSTNNQKKIHTETYTLDRYSTKRTINCAAKLTGVDWVGGTMKISTSYTIEPLTKYTISYNVGEGTGGPSNGTVDHGKNYTIPTAEPTGKGNMNFVYWADSDGKEYSPGDTILNVTSNKVLTACYMGITISSPTVNVSIRYSGNGGSGVNASNTIAIKQGESATFIVTSSTPSREGYEFQNWNSKSDGSGTSYSSGNSITVSKTTTLYAQWKPESHIVEYYISEGQPWVVNGQAQTSTKYTDKDISVLGPPTMSNKIFRYWKFKDPSIAETALVEEAASEIDTNLQKIYNAGSSYSYNKSGGETYLIAEWRQPGGIVFYENGDFECIELKEIDYPSGFDKESNKVTSGAFYQDGVVVFSEFIEDDNGTISFKRVVEKQEREDTDGEKKVVNILKSISLNAQSFKEVE